MEQIAEWMSAAIAARNDEAKLDELKQAITDFALRFPLPSDNK
jgi:hypothetical protein